MRKYITKEVTRTIIRLATIEVTNGSPEAVTLEPIETLGNYDKSKAQKLINKSHQNVTVTTVENITETYQMEITEFIKHATLKEEETK